MDNGEVIPGLNEEWTLGGAKLLEWTAGFSAFIISSEVIFAGQPMGKMMPWLMIIWTSTTFGLAALRRQFPDEEAGMRNWAMDIMGVKPPGIPAQASIQPLWSATPVHELSEHCWYNLLDLDQVFELRREELEQSAKE